MPSLEPRLIGRGAEAVQPSPSLSIRLTNGAILVLWLGAAGYLVAGHVMWRDEVRALSIAMAGTDIVDMARALHGEGHPAVWYILLRLAWSATGHVEVLQVLAVVIGFATVALLVLASPFPRLGVAALALGGLLLYDYTVEARNYGVSALLLFSFATLYPARRKGGFVLGALLFLLANTNIVATVMVGALLVFWLIDLLDETGLQWTPRTTTFVLNALIAAAGVLVCAVTILPTTNDAAVNDFSGASPTLVALRALLDPGSTSLATLLSRAVSRWGAMPSVLTSVVLFAVVAGLAPRRAAFVSALLGLAASALLLALVAKSSYRHAGIWFFFVLSLYWMSWDDIVRAVSGATSRPLARGAALVGLGGVAVLACVQLVDGARHVVYSALGKEPPQSRSLDLARLVSSRADLRSAVIIADPDFLVEALPYYLPNRTFLLRQDAFGSVVKFSRSVKSAVTLGDVLAAARSLRQSERAPVLILLNHRLDEIVPDRLYSEGYDWTFQATTDQIHDFRNATELIARFDRAKTDETYDVYELH